MNSWLSMRDIIKQMGIQSVIASILVFLLAVSATCIGGYQLYHYTKENILLQGELNAATSAKEFDRYLNKRENAVALSGNVVDNLIKDGRPVSEILEYMETESRSLKVTIDKDCTGLYGWIENQYLDGEGWVPEDDYVPTERPWYTETMTDDSEVTYVKPYLDAQTHTVMTTMATKLVDDVSVLAFDVSLGRIQEITEEIAEQTPGSIGVVLDKSGQVIAHSDSDELGKNYAGETDTLGAALADAVLGSDAKQLELSFYGRNYMVYIEEIAGGWKSISMIDTQVFYRPLRTFLPLLIFLTLLEAIVFIVVLYNLISRNLAISIQNTQIGAVADMYVAIFDIDIAQDSIRQIRRGETDLADDNNNVNSVFGENQKNAQETLDEMLRVGVHETSKPIMELFMDLSTLADRLENTETIAEEFLDDKKRWCRARFIVAERNTEGKVIRVMWMIESIDEEKKHREHLKRLSETDQMTGLFNRAAGEAKITELLQRGTGGMLLMIDADKFKSINDNFGHDVGDKVIIGLADAIAHACRNSDVVMRLGGDEFVAFAPGVVTEEAGMHIIDRVFRNIYQTDIEELGDRRVFVSVGAAFCPEGTVVAFNDLYKQADTCAYESKKRTGNTYTFASADESSDNVSDNPSDVPVGL